MERLFLPFVPKVNLVVTHFRPHIDEIGAWWLALRHGESIFPGLGDAQLVLWNAGNKTPDGRTPRQWKEQSGALVLGVGGAKTKENPDGAEFEEHGLFSDETTLILMLKALGLTTEPALRGLSKYTQANDRKGNATPWDLASILKALNAHTLNTIEVAFLVFDLLDSNYARELKADPKWTNYRHADLFDEYLAQWLWEAFAGKAKDTVTRPTKAVQVIEYLRIGAREDISEIVKLAGRDHSKGAAGPFDIVTMFSELVENSAHANTLRNYVYVIMNAKFAQQRRFVQAVDEVRTNAQVTWIGDRGAINEMRKPRTVENPGALKQIADLEALYPEGDEDAIRTIGEIRAMMTKPAQIGPNAILITDGMDGIRPVQVISTVSDNEEVIKVMRVLFPDADFYIRRQPSHHTVINGPKALMDSVCAETRIAENMRRNGSNAPRIPTENLRKAGNIAEDPVWSYHREGGQMLNGSLTSPGAPHTSQTLPGLWKGIARALRHSARFERRVRLVGAPPPSRSGKPSGKPVTPQAPKAEGNRSHDGRNRDRNRNRGRHAGGAGHDGRRPVVSQTTRTAVSSSGGFENKPFAALVPSELVPQSVAVPAVIETPAPTPAGPVVPVPVADASPVSVTEVAPSAPAPKAARKPRVRKAAPAKSGKKAPKA